MILYKLLLLVCSKPLKVLVHVHVHVLKEETFVQVFLSKVLDFMKCDQENKIDVDKVLMYYYTMSM